MAKRRARENVGLVCEKCGQLTHVTEKNKLNTPEPLKLRKFCNVCKEVTDNKEKKKLD